MPAARAPAQAKVPPVGPRTAAEVAAELERRTREDPAFRADRQRAEAERAEQVRLTMLAEQPVVEDLRAIGLDLHSVWDLDKIPDSRPRAIPVLLQHLVLDYPDAVLFGIGQGLDHRSARAWWDDLRAIMLSTERDTVRDRAAAALSTCALREHYDDLMAFVRDDSLGECRIYFLRPINRIGNRLHPGQGRAFLETIADHPVLGKEATAILQGRSRSR